MVLQNWIMEPRQSIIGVHLERSHEERWVLLTRRSENDNTLQPLDQWTNSPFMGHQVWNCKSFTLTHYLADLFAMHCRPTASLCVSNIVHNSHLFHSKWIDFPIPEIWLLKIWPWKSKVNVMGEVNKLWIKFHMWFMELHNSHMYFCKSIWSLQRRFKSPASPLLALLLV